MVPFTPIDLEHWPRREYFEHYTAHVPCTYAITVQVDVTPIAAHGVRLYPAMLYALTTIVNRHEEFRTAQREDGQLGVYASMLPCYTVFHKDTETFSSIWTEYHPSFPDFLAAYEADLATYGNCQGLMGKPDVPENHFPVSMLPWRTFQGFELYLPKSNHYFVPIFTMGRTFSQDGRTLLPLSIQVHHGVCDGFHVCRFVEELEQLIQEIF